MNLDEKDIKSFIIELKLLDNQAKGISTRCRKALSFLEQFSAPAPSGGALSDEEIARIRMKRRRNSLRKAG